MAELKTRKNEASVGAFIEAIENDLRRVTGEDGAMWGASIVGFGNYHYKYASGREGDWFLTGFAPRK